MVWFHYWKKMCVLYVSIGHKDKCQNITSDCSGLGDNTSSRISYDSLTLNTQILQKQYSLILTDQCLSQPSSEKLPPAAVGNKCRIHHQLLCRETFIKPLPRGSGNPVEEKSEGDRRHEGNMTLLNQHGWCSYQLTETEAACTGPVWVCTRWGPRAEVEVDTCPVPKPEAINIDNHLQMKT